MIKVARTQRIFHGKGPTFVRPFIALAVAILAALAATASPVETPSAAAAGSESIRAAFYYGWYPENWRYGHRWTSVSNEYRLDTAAMIGAHIDEMQYGKIDAGIYSWWGKGSSTDKRFASYLQEGAAKSFEWAVYYELDQDGTRSAEMISADLAYLASSYFDSPAYLKVNGKPVVFVYAPNGTCETVAKWTTLRDNANIYVSMTDVPEWWLCRTLDSWHGYKPAERVKAVYYKPTSTVYSISVSAGFWSSNEANPRLSRDFVAWEYGVKAMVTYQPQWQLVYFNEFAEGSNIEPSSARCELQWCLDYLETLRTFR